MAWVTRTCSVCGQEYSVQNDDTDNLCHSCYLKKNGDGEGYYVWLATGSGSIEILAPVQLVRNVCHSGSNDDDVEALLKNNFVKGQLKQYSTETIREEYFELGITDKVTPNREAMEAYLMWSLSWNTFDDGGLDKWEYYEYIDTVFEIIFKQDLLNGIVEKGKKYLIVGTDLEKQIVYFSEFSKEDRPEDEDFYELTFKDIISEFSDGEINLIWK